MIIDKSCHRLIKVPAAKEIDRTFPDKQATIKLEGDRLIVYCNEGTTFSPEEKGTLAGILLVFPEYKYVAGGPKPKDMKGKPVLSLVPRGIVEAIAKVREFGNKKYGNPDGWKMQTKQDYWEACLRHAEKARNNMDAIDEESGLPHIYHLACDLSFMLSGELK
jgi:hypothetical protein